MHTTLNWPDPRVYALLAPPPHLSLAEWADTHFLLPSGDANAGRWRCLPYQRGILDAISDEGIERVTVMKSARVGYTKSFCAAVGYYIAHDPCPILVVQPTIEDAERHSKEDLAPMLEEIPVLRALVAPSRSRDSSNTILTKLFKGGSLSIVGANSPRGFRRTSRRVVIFDEVDGYPASAGTEGDQIALGIRRTEYYWNRKILAGSTPTVAGISRIERLFAEGDQRRYYVPCPQCGHMARFVFNAEYGGSGHVMKWPEEKPQEAYFICEKNGCVIEEKDKRGMVEKGEWRAEHPENFTPEHRHASFHMWAAYSYSPNATWGQLAAEWITANRGGSLTRMTFINTALGETWQDRGEAPEWERLMQRREPYRIGTVPMGALFLTAGVDVQKDRLIVEVVAWGRGKVSWSVDYAILPGDTSALAQGPWKQLDAFLERRFPHAGGTELPIAMLAIDSGYNTQTVYGWARRYPMTRVIATKGVTHASAFVGAPSPVEVSDRGRKLKRGYKVWTVCAGIGKSELYGWLGLAPPVEGGPTPPGFCHFPEYASDYFQQLTAEQFIHVKDRKGYIRHEWSLIPGRENHVLDCRILARAAAQVAGLDRFQESDWRALERSVGISEDAVNRKQPTPAPPGAVKPPPPPQPPPRRRTPWLSQRGGWLTRR